MNSSKNEHNRRNEIILSVILLVVLFGKYSEIFAGRLRLDYLVVITTSVIMIIVGKIKFEIKEVILICILMTLLFIPTFDQGDVFSIRSLKYIFYFAYGISIVEILHSYKFILEDHRFKATVYKVLKIFCFINVIIAIWEIKTGNHFKYGETIRYTETWSNIPAGLFFNFNDYAIFIFMLIPLFVHYKDKKLSSFVIIISSIILLFVIGSRTAIICTFALFFIDVQFDRKSKKFSAKKMLVYLLLGLCAIAIIYNLTNSSNTYMVIEKIKQSKDFGGRGKILTEYLYILKDNLWGKGILSYNLWESGDLTNPHNMLIELMLYFGVFGGIFVYIKFIIITVKSLRKSLKTKDAFFLPISLSFLFLICVAHIGVSSVFSGFSVFWVFLGLIKANLVNSKEEVI